MSNLPVAPVGVPVSSIGQALMTTGVAAGCIATVAVAVRLARRYRTWAPLLIPAGTLIAGLMEPLPDASANIWYYRPGQVTAWTSNGVSLPVWVFFSYTAFYGGFGLLFWWLAERGTTRRLLTRSLGGMWILAIATEVIGTTLKTYTYYGRQPFRVHGFPIWVSLYNVAIIATVGFVAARLRRVLPPRRLVVPALALPTAAIVVGLVGTAFPMLNVIRTVNPSNWQLYPAAIASLVLAAVMGWCALLTIPEEGLTPITAPAALTLPRLDQPLPPDPATRREPHGATHRAP